MNDNEKKVIIIGAAAVAVVAIAIAIYLYCEHERDKKRIAELEEDKLKLILDSLKHNSSLSEEVKRQLEKMIDQFNNVDKKISNELAQALQFFQIGKVEDAIRDLVKIIEHLLTAHYENDSKFKTWLKEKKAKFDLHNLLTFCKEEGKISEIEFRFYLAIKTIRNKEVHTIDLNLDGYLNASGLIAAIGAILKIASIVYPNKQKNLG